MRRSSLPFVSWHTIDATIADVSDVIDHLSVRGQGLLVERGRDVVVVSLAQHQLAIMQNALAVLLTLGRGRPALLDATGFAGFGELSARFAVPLSERWISAE